MLLINDICKEQGITQKELAEKIGITPVGLNKAINGNPTKTTLEKVAKALNVKVSDLFAEDEEPKKEKILVDNRGEIRYTNSCPVRDGQTWRHSSVG